MNVPLWITPGRIKFALIVGGVWLALLALPTVLGVASSVFVGETEQQRAYDARMAEQQRRQHVKADSLKVHALAYDSVSAEAGQARRRYVIAKRHATEAVAALPRVAITPADSTITISDTAYTVPRRVVLYVTELQTTVALQGLAIMAGDTAVVKTVAAEDHAKDVIADATALASGADSIATMAIEQERRSRPGFFSRAWSALQKPVYFGLGVVTGALAARLVR